MSVDQEYSPRLAPDAHSCAGLPPSYMVLCKRVKEDNVHMLEFRSSTLFYNPRLKNDYKRTSENYHCMKRRRSIPKNLKAAIGFI